MKLITLLYFFLSTSLLAQDFGEFPKIEQDKLYRDLEILQQRLDNFYTGMYWYNSKDRVEQEFDKARVKINSDLQSMSLSFIRYAQKHRGLNNNYKGQQEY